MWVNVLVLEEGDYAREKAEQMFVNLGCVRRIRRGEVEDAHGLHDVSILEHGNGDVCVVDEAPISLVDRLNVPPVT